MSARRTEDVTHTATRPQPETAPQPLVGEVLPIEDAREWQTARLRLLWQRRQFFVRAAAFGLIASTLVAFLIPRSYESTTRLMPPDTQSSSSLAMLAAM